MSDNTVGYTSSWWLSETVNRKH